MYGHRRDPEGYGRALEEFDAMLPAVIHRMKPEDLLIICADHGNDPVRRLESHPGIRASSGVRGDGA